MESNSSNKYLKTRYKSFIVDQKAFEKFEAYAMLMLPDDRLEAGLTGVIKISNRNCSISMLHQKVKAIKSLEGALGVGTFDIDTERDLGRFDFESDVDVSAIRDSIKKLFRIRKDLTDNKYGFWYEILCYMYRHLFGTDFVVSSRTRKYGGRKCVHKLNARITKVYQDLYAIYSRV